ncbi:hypothetical protein [Pseudomonas donghuensis]|uniref:hypothetical protein n=1 Tax=Pseudomonas donghuensis TaxID=1163398 RepID=UPI0020C1CCE9|nr:hypothetical protein [Pseudomonas donghuensis]MCP6696395.1 hypothetical protein [Pseudomonas donghuensis]
MSQSAGWKLMVGSGVGLCVLLAVALLKDHKVVLAELQFQGGAHPRHDTTQVHEGYLQAMQHVLAAQQLDVQQLQLELAPQRSDTLLLRGAENALAPAQRQGLNRQFEAILRARKAVVPSLQLTLDYSQARRLNAAGQEIGQAPANVVAMGRKVLALWFEFPSEVSLNTLVSDSERRHAFAGSRTVNGEAICQVDSFVQTALPFIITRFKADGALLVGDMDILTHDQMALRVPASLYFDDRDLRVRLEAGGLKVSVDSQMSYGKFRSSWLSIEFGSLGVHPYQPFDLADAGREGLREMCSNFAYQAGRPFSFFYGVGLDRLETVRIAPAG